jgi:hypothetical protein
VSTDLCGAHHPDKDLAIQCVLFAGPNAMTQPVIEIAYDDAGNPVGEVEVEPARPIHVHKGLDPQDGSAHRWEDALEESSNDEQ